MGELYSIFSKERMKITDNIEILFDTIMKQLFTFQSGAPTRASPAQIAAGV
jgi:hypothetical protein